MDAVAPRRITKPGIYDIPSNVYHSDCCDGPSLSSTGARLLVSECPAVYRWRQDNPLIKEEFEIGNATHLLVLEPDLFRTQVKLIQGFDKNGNPSEGYKSQDAKDKRDAARADGLIPLLPEQLEQVECMRSALFADPIAQFALTNGIEVERSLFWRDPDYGFYGKCRPDVMPSHRHYLVDLKTSTTADPDAFQRAIYNYGYAQQADYYLTGVEQVFGRRPEQFFFIVVCKTPPYLVTTCRLTQETIGWGGVLNRKARGIFAWCIQHNQWPSYRPVLHEQPAAFEIGLPEWALREYGKRLDAGDFEPPPLDEREAA